MDDELRNKFTMKKIADLKSNNLNLLPTIICEMDDPKIMDIVRRNIFVAIKYGGLVTFKPKSIKITEEILDLPKSRTNWGEMYIDVNVN